MAQPRHAKLLGCHRKNVRRQSRVVSEPTDANLVVGMRLHACKRMRVDQASGD